MHSSNFLRPTVFLQSHPFTFTTTESEDKIVFYAKIKNGITENISKYLSRLPGNTATIRVLVEGPYGEPSGAGRSCKNVVFIAGGNGIPGIYSECVDLAKKSKNQSIKLVWIIRHWKSLSWFTEELEYLKKTSVQTTVYVTQPQDYNGMKSLNKTQILKRNQMRKIQLNHLKTLLFQKSNKTCHMLSLSKDVQTLLNKLNKKSRKQTVHLGSLRVDILPWLMN